jgi:hypothetical protein
MLHSNATLTTPQEHLHAQNDETNDNIKYLQSYLVVAADALLEIGTAHISAVLSLYDHLSQTVPVHLHSSCATGVSSGLATMVTLTPVSRGRLEESILGGGGGRPASGSSFIP